MSAECKKLRGPNDTGPDCGCRGDACALGRDAASTHGLGELGVIWRVQWLHFNAGADSDHVNAEIERVAVGWEPFATIQNPTGGWALLVKREVS